MVFYYRLARDYRPIYYVPRLHIHWRFKVAWPWGPWSVISSWMRHGYSFSLTVNQQITNKRKTITYSTVAYVSFDHDIIILKDHHHEYMRAIGVYRPFDSDCTSNQLNNRLHVYTLQLWKWWRKATACDNVCLLPLVRPQKNLNPSTMTLRPPLPLKWTLLLFDKKWVGGAWKVYMNEREATLWTMERVCWCTTMDKLL